MFVCILRTGNSLYHYYNIKVYFTKKDWTVVFIKLGAVMVLIVWYLDLQLPMQSVPITTNVVSSNLTHGKLYSVQHYMRKVCQWLAVGQ